MASVRAHLLNWFLRHFVKPQMKRLKTPLEGRQALDRVISPRHPQARYAAATIGGLSGERVDGPGAPFGTLLYLHGGAYIAMSSRTHHAITGAFAAGGLRVFAPDYRLAPEHPFPAALDDAIAGYEALRREAQGPLFVAGDSAGGGLALALMLRLRDEGRPLPAGAVLFSPWTDLAATGASLKTNRRRDPLFDPDSIPETAAYYYGKANPRDPLVSPLYGDMKGLPPLNIWVGKREILLDDSRRVAEKARAAGVRVELEVRPVVPHVWQLLGGFLPEAVQSLDKSVAFLRGCVRS